MSLTVTKCPNPNCCGGELQNEGNQGDECDTCKGEGTVILKPFKLRFTYPGGQAAQSLWTKAADLKHATRKGNTVVKERLHPSFFNERNTGLESGVRFYLAEPVEDEGMIAGTVEWI